MLYILIVFTSMLTFVGCDDLKIVGGTSAETFVDHEHQTISTDQKRLDSDEQTDEQLNGTNKNSPQLTQNQTTTETGNSSGNNSNNAAGNNTVEDTSNNRAENNTLLAEGMLPEDQTEEQGIAGVTEQIPPANGTENTEEQIVNPRPHGELLQPAADVGGGGPVLGSELYDWLMRAVVYENGDVSEGNGYPETAANIVDGDWSTFWRNRTNANFEPTSLVVDLLALNKPDCLVENIKTKLSWDQQILSPELDDTKATIVVDFSNVDVEEYSSEVVFDAATSVTTSLLPESVNSVIDLVPANSRIPARFVRLRWVDRLDDPDAWNGYGSIYELNITCASR